MPTYRFQIDVNVDIFRKGCCVRICFYFASNSSSVECIKSHRLGRCKNFFPTIVLHSMTDRAYAAVRLSRCINRHMYCCALVIMVNWFSVIFTLKESTISFIQWWTHHFHQRVATKQFATDHLFLSSKFLFKLITFIYQAATKTF